MVCVTGVYLRDVPNTISVHQSFTRIWVVWRFAPLVLVSHLNASRLKVIAVLVLLVLTKLTHALRMFCGSCGKPTYWYRIFDRKCVFVLFRFVFDKKECLHILKRRHPRYVLRVACTDGPLRIWRGAGVVGYLQTANHLWWNINTV